MCSDYYTPLLTFIILSDEFVRCRVLTLSCGIRCRVLVVVDHHIHPYPHIGFTELEFLYEFFWTTRSGGIAVSHSQASTLVESETST